jgi:ssRNA-specific RNase YbeY (16S rRNA maturation enzyme)
MEIAEAFGKAVNLAQKKGIEKSLELLGLSNRKIEDLLERKKFVIQEKDFDIVIDKKEKLKQLNLYLTGKKWSGKLLISLKKSSDFKSMVIYLGNIVLSRKVYELRLGAFGIPSSELVKAVIKFKK